MKKRMLMFAFVCVALVGFSAPNHLILIVEKDQEKVKMMWNFSELPENVTGFYLQKRAAGNELWQNAGSSNIRFGMNKKNIKNAEISKDHKKKLLEKYSRLLTNDDRLTSANINNYLKEHPDEKSFLLWALCMDYETSLISGLGYIDEFESSKENWQYRVIPIVDKEVKEELASDPVTVHNQDNFSKNIDVQTAFVKYADKIDIHVNATRQAFENKNIKGFITYHLHDDGSKVPVSKYLAIPKKKRQGYAAVTSAKNIDPDKAHTFIIQPITIFDSRCEPVLVNYRPD